MKNVPSHDPEEYTVVPIIPVDGFIHNEYCFCDDMSHECHENPESITDLNAAVLEGELTVAEADLIFRAKTI